VEEELICYGTKQVATCMREEERRERKRGRGTKQVATCMREEERRERKRERGTKQVATCMS